MITIPGKFEGAHDFAPHYYSLWAEGFFDDEVEINGTWITFHNVLDEDIAKFPELNGFERVALWETDQGFVHCIPTNEAVPS